MSYYARPQYDPASPARGRRVLRRRRFLRAGLVGALAQGSCYARSAVAAPATTDLTVTKIDRVTVKVPFRPVPARNMARELPHWKYSEICTVRLASGQLGHGETLLYYTPAAVSEEAVQRVQGRNAASLMWDDSLGTGLQMALFDAVARACDVPIHRLLGVQLYQQTPLSWWNIDTTVEDMASECREAQRLGYLAYKTKGRPWFDIWAQMEAAVQGLPPEFKIDMDYNDTLLTAEKGLPILKDLAEFPQTDIYETPIPQGDIAGNQAIRHATRVQIAMHYGNPRPRVAIQEGVCDGFVIGGGASRVVRQAHVAAMAEMPFWLQLVGTGITAAWSLHFGAVLKNATWPAVNCHQLYAHDLLTRRIKLPSGKAAIPTGPGLGFDIDWVVVDRFRVDKPLSRPDPSRLVETRWTDGRRMYFNHLAGVNFVVNPARRPGVVPYYERGVQTRLYPNDGTAQWKERYEKSRQGPLLEKD